MPFTMFVFDMGECSIAKYSGRWSMGLRAVSPVCHDWVTAYGRVSKRAAFKWSRHRFKSLGLKGMWCIWFISAELVTDR